MQTKDKTAIVITTINIPKILINLCENMVKYKHLDDTFILVIGDKKTPIGIKVYIQGIINLYNANIEYLGIEEQMLALKEYPELLQLIPYNTPDRVMLGCMLAYLKGCCRVIALDDDNFPTKYDFVGFHNITGKVKNLNLIKNDSGWFNVHSALKEKKNIPFYPRGYPWSKRNEESSEKEFVVEERKVIANQGLVLEDSDVDAITRLFYPIRATKMKTGFSKQFGLYPGVWSPFNFQNTCLDRELIPIYYRPLSTLRNGDIWTAYLINKLAHHFGDVITFGQPLVNQIRNTHDIWDDLNIELTNNKATDRFVEVLRNIEVEGDNYFDVLGDLLKKSQKEVNKIKDNTPIAEYDMIENYFKEYKTWYEIMKKIK